MFYLVNAVIKIKLGCDFLLLSFSLMGSLSPLNFIRHYILHCHVMQYLETVLFCLPSIGSYSYE